MTRLLKWIVLLPIVAIVVVFAVVNRHSVSVVFDPTGNRMPGLTFEAPLFLILFATLIIGVLLGGCASWLKQGKYRKAAREARHDAQKLEGEAEKLRAQVAAVPALASPTDAYTGSRAS